MFCEPVTVWAVLSLNEADCVLWLAAGFSLSGQRQINVFSICPGDLLYQWCLQSPVYAPKHEFKEKRRSGSKDT